MKKRPVRPPVTPDAVIAKPNRQSIADAEVADLAYSYWLERGAEPGSPEEDWYRAVEELRRRRETRPAAAPRTKTSSAAAS